MNKDLWTNTSTLIEHGINGALGSPRSWLRRALDATTLDDYTFPAGSLTPQEISIAGVWYRPITHTLPDTAYHQLYRFFDIPTADKILRPKTRTELYPAIGIAAAVPASDILNTIKLYQMFGAAFIWWSMPLASGTRTGTGSIGHLRERRRLDHDEVYRRLAAGQNRKEIALALGFPTNNIDYVISKWRAQGGGVPVPPPPRPRIDAAAMVADYASGMRAVQLAEKYNTSEAYVYKLIKQQRCLALNQP